MTVLKDINETLRMYYEMKSLMEYVNDYISSKNDSFITNVRSECEKTSNFNQSKNLIDWKGLNLYTECKDIYISKEDMANKDLVKSKIISELNIIIDEIISHENKLIKDSIYLCASAESENFIPVTIYYQIISL